MSLIPTFEIGMWNVWIFMPYYLLTIPLVRLINKDALEKGDVAAPRNKYNKTEKRMVDFYHVILRLDFKRETQRTFLSILNI